MKKKLLNHEKLLMKALAKRLPEDALCELAFHRYVNWCEAVRSFLKPEVSNDLVLRVCFRSADDPTKPGPRFEWRGKKLEAGMRALDNFLAAQHHKALPSSQQKLAVSKTRALPEGHVE
jgi:hypothetical protein